MGNSYKNKKNSYIIKYKKNSYRGLWVGWAKQRFGQESPCLTVIPAGTLPEAAPMQIA